METLENGSTTETTQTESVGSETATTTETTPAVEKQASVSSPVEDSQQTGTEETKAAAEVAAYAPNYKFKVKDKEFEIDEFLRGSIKDQAVEKKVKELYEKAYGLDEVKNDRETLKKELATTKPQLENVRTSLAQLGKFIQEGDFRSFIEALKIPKELALRYALEEFKFQDLPPEQKAEIEAQRQREQQFLMAQQQNQTLSEQVKGMAFRQAKLELDTELSRPEISSMAQSFDTRAGMQGSFMREVIKRGQMYEALNGTSISVKQAVDEVIALIGGVPQATPTANGMGQPGQVIQQTAKPTIKTFSGSSQASPTKKVYSSIDEIREARQKLNQAQA